MRERVTIAVVILLLILTAINYVQWNLTTKALEDAVLKNEECLRSPYE